MIEHLADKRVLLILDNCEHLVDACARVVDALLRACNGVTLLCTSREILRVEGEISYRVPALSMPLETPATGHTRETLSAYEALALFLDRAGAANPTLQVTAANAGTIVAICRQLDGIPLALELAAARLRAMSPEMLLERLDQRFRLLTCGTRAALPRQQTLHAVIDWSYQLLSEQERAVFRRLAAFVGGWTLEAAEAVCAADEVERWEMLDLLTALVDKSLVLAETDADGYTRYRFLESVREFAAAHLRTAGEAPACHRRHLAFFRGWYLDHFHMPQDPDRAWRVANRLMGNEIPNLQLAVMTAVRDEPPRWDDAVILLLMHRNLFAFAWHETPGILERSLPYLDAAVPMQFPPEVYVAQQGAQVFTLAPGGIKATVCFYLAQLTGGLYGQHAKVIAYLEQALKLYRQTKHPIGIANCLRELAAMATRQGDATRAAALLDEALDVLSTVENTENRIFLDIMFSRGTLALTEGDTTRARALLEEWSALCRNKSEGIFVLAQLEYLDGKLARARAYCEEAISALHRWEIIAPLPLRVLGDIAREDNQPAEAARYYAESWAEWGQPVTNPEIFMIHLESYAYLAVTLGKPAVAARLLGCVARLREESGSPRNKMERYDYDRYWQRVGEAIPPATLDTLLRNGFTLSMHEALALAQDETAVPVA